MRRRRVTVHATVADDTGREHRVRQRSLRVRAPSEVSAVWQARALLRAGARVVDWRPRADSREVAAPPAADGIGPDPRPPSLNLKKSK